MGKELQKGELIAKRYTVDRHIGAGGVGSVYLVNDNELGGRPVALKVLSSSFARDTSMYRRFQDEVSLTRELSHPNIIRIYDIGRDENDLVFLTMEYVEGKSLAKLIRAFSENNLPFEDVVWILTEICQGLQIAHKKGVTHRDLKPENVLISTEGELRLLDFGLARWRGTKRRTAIGETVGTPLYMAPEQFRGKDVDGRCDIYTLGILAYEIVVGEPPFFSKKVETLAEMHSKAPFPNIRDKRADVPVWYQHFTKKCSAKRPMDRFQSCNEAIAYIKEYHKVPTSDSRTNIELSQRVTTIKQSVQQARSKAKSQEKAAAAQTQTQTQTQFNPQRIPQKFHRRHLKVTRKSKSSKFSRYLAFAFVLAMAAIIFIGSK